MSDQAHGHDKKGGALSSLFWGTVAVLGGILIIGIGFLFGKAFLGILRGGLEGLVQELQMFPMLIGSFFRALGMSFAELARGGINIVIWIMIGAIVVWLLGEGLKKLFGGGGAHH